MNEITNFNTLSNGTQLQVFARPQEFYEMIIVWNVFIKVNRNPCLN